MKILHPAMLAALLVLAVSSNAAATGIGPIFEYGNVFYTHGFGYDFDENHYGVGVAVDTNVAANHLFNYRLDAEYKRIDWDSHGGGGHGDALSLDNVFGVGVLRTSSVRLWVGPSVRVAFNFYDDPSFFEFGIGAGPEVGINIHTSGPVTFAISGGYQTTYAVDVPEHGSNADGFTAMAFVKVALFFRTADDTY